MAHWTDKYVGLAYAEDFDCVHLLCLVQNEVFNRDVAIPVEREANIVLKTRQINQHKEHYLTPVTHEESQDGDAVILRCRGRLNHTGVLATIHGTPYILHNVKNIGSVVMTKVKDLERIGMEIEGYYRPKLRSELAK